MRKLLGIVLVAGLCSLGCSDQPTAKKGTTGSTPATPVTRPTPSADTPPSPTKPGDTKKDETGKEDTKKNGDKPKP